MLATLDRANLFVVPLDDQRDWYRYHALFADVLRVHLTAEQPGRVPQLHRRAGGWFEQHGEPAEAIRHALAAGDFEWAADLIEGQIPTLRRRRQERLLLDWLDALPNAIVHRRPALGVIAVGALLASGQAAAAEQRLDEVERTLAGTLPEPGAEAVTRVPATIALYRTALAQVHGDLTRGVEHARRALTLASPDDHVTRAGAAGFLGIALWVAGDLEAAGAAWMEAAEGLRRAGHVSDSLGAAIAIGDIRLVQGRLGEAVAQYEAALRLAEQGRTVVRGTADVHVGLAELHLERDDRAAAQRHLTCAEELGEAAGLPQFPYRYRATLSRLRRAEGDLAAADELLAAAEAVRNDDFFPPWRPLAARRVRVWLAQGRLDRALAWFRERRPDAEPGFLHEYEHLTVTRVLLAGQGTEGFTEGTLADAETLLGSVLADAEAAGRWRTVIEALALQALAAQAVGDLTVAVARLERALTLAEPEGISWVFLEEGRPMLALLRQRGRGRTSPWLTAHLLAVKPTSASQSAGVRLIDPLSERERDVLRLLDTELSGPEIARRLVVSLNTVRTHTKNIYAKLGVDSRRAAVGRARELGLLDRLG